MNLHNNTLLLFITSFIFSIQSLGSKDVLTFGNSYFKKTFIAQTGKSDAISVRIFDQNNIQVNNSDHPFFEFALNNTIVKSSDKIWQFEDFSERKMRNEGHEYKLNFIVSKGPLIGLKATLIQQYFPSSTVVREKLLLSANDGKRFNLSKVQNENHFQFPNYQILSNNADKTTTTEIKLASWELKPTTFGEKVKGNHMYYPKISEHSVGEASSIQKGPILLTSDDHITWFTAFEHASQDNTNGMFEEGKKNSEFIVDAMQGTKGVFNFPVKDSDFIFLGIATSHVESAFNVGVSALRGAYYENEVIDNEHSYESVWSASGHYMGKDLGSGKEMLRHYILEQINENPASREIEFYYNTWGLQRNDKSKPLRGILTYDRIFEEIEYAAKLGVDIFVLDDGWEEAQGDWTPNRERLTEGLAPIKEKLDSLGIKMGLWLSPMGIDSTTQRYKDHPEWVIKDSENKPILAQWGHPAFDFVGGFYDLFIEDCKKLIDQGCLFMKWDAINTFYSSLPNLDHGDQSVSKEERRARYEYLLPIYVTKAMEELTAYEPELVIEIDITEARRVMTGLAVLSQGKFFWMNNGASGYNDYSTYRAQSMRTIINEYAELLPREVLTYANYPHNQEGALEYNVMNSILAGNGFWGNLSLMKENELERVGEFVMKAKPLQLGLYGIAPYVLGKVGDSPEIYSFYDEKTGSGQVISFSTDEGSSNFRLKINRDKTLGAVNIPFKLMEDTLMIELNHRRQYSSNLVPIVSNNGHNYAIALSTSPIGEIKISERGFEYTTAAKGQQIIRWGKELGEPKISSSNALISSVEDEENGAYYRIQINNSTSKQMIKIEML